MKLNSSIARATITAAATMALTLTTVPVFAALGDSAQSINTDSAVMRGVLRSTGFTQYDVQEIDSGVTTVREYSTRSGQVFAITWQGADPPNLQQVLGAYYSRLEAASKTARVAQGTSVHRVFHVDQSDFVMRSVARMRDFHGLAYIPALVPDGVSVEQLP